MSDLENDKIFFLRTIRNMGIHNERMKEPMLTESDILNKLNEAGFSPEKVRQMKFDNPLPDEILYGGYSFKFLKDLGVRPSTFIGMKYVSHQSPRGPFHDRISIMNSRDLIPAFGFTLEELLEDGFTEKDVDPKHLKEAGYNVSQIKNLGFSSFSIFELFNFKDLATVYQPRDFRREKVEAKSLIDYFSCSELAQGGYSAIALQRAGFGAKEIREAGFPAKKLRRGFRFYANEGRVVAGAMFPVKDLKEAGYTPLELKEAKVSAEKMKEAGFSREELNGVFVDWHLDKVYSKAS